MRALCVGRHQFLSEHLARYFRELGVDTLGVVGLEDAAATAREWAPDVVLCDYDLLATLPLGDWEHDALLSRTPVVAVSLTRRPDEEPMPPNVNGIAGPLYLPALSGEDALALVTAAARGRAERAGGRGVVPPPGALPSSWPGAPASSAPLH